MEPQNASSYLYYGAEFKAPNQQHQVLWDQNKMQVSLKLQPDLVTQKLSEWGGEIFTSPPGLQAVWELMP